MEGLPQPGVLASVGATLSGSSFWLTAIPSAVGAVLLALLALGLARRYRPAFATDSTSSFSEGDAGLSPQRSAIVSALAELDNRYQDGDLEEADYLAHRSELVAEAMGEYPYADDGEAPEDDKLITDEQSGERYA